MTTPSPFAAPARSTSTPRLDLSSFLNTFEDVTFEHDGWVVTCPAHADSRPSLRVAVNESSDLLLYCRAGCSIDDITQASNITKAQLFNVDTSNVSEMPTLESTTVAVGAREQAALATYLERAATALGSSTEAQKYTLDRFGITPPVADSLCLGFDDTTIHVPGLALSRTAYHADPRVVVPFLDFDGEPVGMQARAITSNASVRWSGPINPSTGGTWSKYGFFQADSDYPEVIVTEGPGDALTAYAAGYSVLIVRGAALASSETLADALALGLKGRRIIVAGDNDSAGMAFTNNVCEALSTRGLDTYRLVLPTAVSDITAWRESNPLRFAEQFQQAVSNALTYGSDEVEATRLRTVISRLFTDTENAKALRSYLLSHGFDIRYDTSTGFIYYSGHAKGTWTIDGKGDLWTRGKAQEVLEYLQDHLIARVNELEATIPSISSATTRDDLYKLCGKTKGKLTSDLAAYVQSTRGLDAMLRELQALRGVRMNFASDFDAHPDLLAVANGIVDLRTGELTPYSDETKTLYLIRRVNVPYNPTATCPRWERFVNEIVYDPFRNQTRPKLADYLQVLMGYAITGHTTDSVIAVFKGEGANGKSVFLDTLSHVFEEHTKVTSFSTFERSDGGSSGGAASPDIASLAGARLVVASEGENGKAMATALLKRLSGNEKVSARFLYKEEFTFKPQAQIILATNHNPQFRDRDQGIWRRIHLVPFLNRFEGPSKDKFLEAKFLGQAVPDAYRSPDDNLGDGILGILNWAVQGAKKWYTEGLNVPHAVQHGTDELKTVTDQLADFIEEKLVHDRDNAKIGVREAFLLYQEWAEEEGMHGNEVWRRKTFKEAMEERGALLYRTGGVPTFKHYRKRVPSDNIDESDAAPPLFAVPSAQDQE